MQRGPIFRSLLGLLVAGTLAGIPEVLLSQNPPQPQVATFPPVPVFAAPAQARPPQIVAVRAGRLFDPRSGTLLADQVIVVRGEQIVDIGPAVQIPPGANVIDLSRATVLPGLIDVHVHSFLGNPLIAPGGPGIRPDTGTPVQSPQYRILAALINVQRDLNAGFTSVVDVGSAGGQYGPVALRNAINNGLVEGPRMQVAGPTLDNTTKGNGEYRSGVAPPLNYEPTETANTADGPWEVRRAVRRLASNGVDWVKIHSTEGFDFRPDGVMVVTPSFTLEEHQALVAEAHRKGLKVACHAYAGEGLYSCLAAGANAVHHAIEMDDQALKLFIDRKAIFVPTLLDIAFTDERDMKRWGTSVYRRQEIGFKKAVAAGVKIAFGGAMGLSAPNKLEPHGYQVIQFVYFVKWGMKPVDALRSATTNAAELIGWQDRVGTLEKGKFADLVAVSGDPLADITEMLRIKFVMKGGRVVRNELK